MGIQDSIISYIRSGIVSGKFKPGSRLKGREYFCEKFSTTPITVQRAFNRLIKMGFVTAEKSVGTFVAEKPSCLHQVALLFSASPDSSNWTSFSQVVVDNILKIEKQANVTIKCFFGMGKSEDNSEVFEEFQKHLDEQTLVAAIYLSEFRNFRKRAWSNVNIPYYVVAQPNQAHVTQESN
ncbi:MAG: winged helix-turn-helix domain-containing protein [Kiritimatiellae bacterium]|jgi:DNA-binding transcriptional MocR family regulator|nr:winged helix-turn-helix domain-containing protein [Kiritimatiellia bacterium]